jgi:hypothetical protein
MHELTRIDPTKAARLLAIIYGVVFGVFSLIFVPVLLFAPEPPPGFNQPPKALFLVFVVLYPLMAAAMGWISGQLGSRVYNWAARKYGGLVFETRSIEHTTR